MKEDSADVTTAPGPSSEPALEQTLTETCYRTLKRDIISGVRPDQFGQVFIDLTLKQGSYAHINAMKVTAIAAIPEPSSLLLLLTCVTGLGFSNRRRTSVAARRNLRNA
jgi:hypothetical protein